MRARVFNIMQYEKHPITGEPLIDEDIIHIEGVLGQLQIAVSQKLGAIDDRVHQKVLGGAEAADLIPAKDTVFGKYVAVGHDLLSIVLYMLVDVVGNCHVDRLSFLQHIAKAGEQTAECAGIYPVVRVNDLVIHAACVTDAWLTPSPWPPFS